MSEGNTQRRINFGRVCLLTPRILLLLILHRDIEKAIFSKLVGMEYRSRRMGGKRRPRTQTSIAIITQLVV